jgi:hypothetical protein
VRAGQSRIYLCEGDNSDFFCRWHLGKAQQIRLDDGLPAIPEVARRPLLSAAVAGVLSVATNSETIPVLVGDAGLVLMSCHVSRV